MKIWSSRTYLFKKMLGFNLALHRSKAQLAPPAENIHEIYDGGANFEIGEWQDKHLHASEVLILKCKLNFKCKLIVMTWYFKNCLQFSKITKNRTAQKLEQNNINVRLDAPWNLAKLDLVLNFFIYFYKLLKVPLFFWLYISTNWINLKKRNTHVIRVTWNKTKFEHTKEQFTSKVLNVQVEYFEFEYYFAFLNSINITNNIVC